MRTYKEIRTALKKIYTAVTPLAPDGRFIRDEPYSFDRQLSDVDIESDRSFLDAWTRPLELASASVNTLNAMFPKVGPTLQYLETGTTFVDPLSSREWVVDVESGIYNRQELLKGIRNYIRRRKNPNLLRFDFSKYKTNEKLVHLYYKRQDNRLLANTEGTVFPFIAPSKRESAPWRTLPGLLVNKMYGKPGAAISSEQYLKTLPALYTGLNHFGFLYTTCVWDESLAPEWDKAPVMLKMFNDMLRLLPQVSCYGTIPCRLRYTGFGRESQGGIIRKIDEPYSRSDNTLLYDGIAWILLLTINGQPIQGRVAVTEEGRFVVSEWCFRETPKQNERYEMFSGAFVKHTLLTWCAGPLLDRFGQSTIMFSQPGAVDGRTPDTGDNPYRMKQLSSVAPSSIAKKIIKELIEGDKLKKVGMSYRDVQYPAAFYLPSDSYVVYCIGYNSLYNNLKAKYLYSFANDKHYVYDEESGYPVHWRGVVREIPLALVEMLFNITPKRAPEPVPEPPIEAIAALEIPTPGAEPVFITPTGVPTIPQVVPIPEPESVPPEPMEAP